jgi:hypothetical protein
MRPRSLLSLSLLLLLATPLSGQVRIVGRVVDDLTEVPLSQAQVSLLARDGLILGRTETDQAGTFEFEVRRVTAVRIQARRLSYRSNTTPLLHFEGRQFFQVEVRLDPDALLLAPLEVIAWSEGPENALHAGFRQRLAMGLGTYITREDVERRQPFLVTDMFRDVPGLVVMGSGTGSRPIVQVARSTGSNCATQVFVDGFLMNRRLVGRPGMPAADFRIDDVVSPVSVEGIEIYRGLSTVPPEFLNPDAECGVIAIWTRRGGRR